VGKGDTRPQRNLNRLPVFSRNQGQGLHFKKEANTLS
jgi:hypothetical protein